MQKPSAIFSVRNSFTAHNPLHPFSSTSDPEAATLGIAIEPLADVLAQVANLRSSIPDPVQKSESALHLAEAIGKHFFNYLSSFAGGPLASDARIPLAIITKWYESFLNKLRTTGTAFLDRSE